MKKYFFQKVNGKYKCDECDKWFASFRIVKGHKRVIHRNIRYNCELCDKIYKSRFSLKSHINEVHCDKSLMKTFNCDICGISFTRNSYLSYHKLRFHSKKVELKCDFPQCQYKTDWIHLLKQHQSKVHFKNKQIIENHEFECKTCAKIFNNKVSFQTHNRNIHSLVTYKCDFDDCDFETKDKRNSREHKLRHLGEKKFKCEWNHCDKCFVTKNGRTNHINRVHKDIRPFNCVWPQCELKFKSKAELQRHMCSHTGDRPLKCDWSGCQMAFKCAAELCLHRRKHKGGLVCDWPECGKSFLGDLSKLNNF
jgi:KRAB domain-containing zinc finger protein